MSQAKVDKYKEEKKNRVKILKKQKAKKAATIFVCAALAGLIIGYPVGKGLYKVSVKNREANATFAASAYDTWFNQKWAGNYSGVIPAASDTDAEASTETSTENTEYMDEMMDKLGLDSTDFEQVTTEETIVD
jgi:hypothetical protein